jgi:phosphoribosyl 1,2-cyclic phosphodiesterase/ActR/RegA family two-component response regulator
MNKPRKGRILIGEDVRVVALKMSQVLEKAGYEVAVAADGQACLEQALLTAPDLVMLDIMMPKLHGIDVLKALRADPRTRDVGVMVCSAKDFKTERDEAGRLGALEFLIKPVGSSTLLKKVDAYFGRRSSGSIPDVTPSAKLSPAVYHTSLHANRSHFTLWGTRGSTPTVGGRFQRHGGNTSCLSITLGDRIFIFDAGSGIRDLGLQLLAGKTREVYLFITHPHWDHIQGFPFFAPAYVPGFNITVYGAKGFGKDLESLFRGQLDRDYFPVQLDDMKSNLQFRHLPEGAIEIGDARITWEFAQHPGATVGYKITVPRRTIAWVPDNEFLQGYLGPPSLQRDHPLVSSYEKMITFLSDADLVIHEGQYLPEEYATKISWGHSSVANVCLLMKLANVRRWVITHHDPMHDDDFLEAKLNLTRQIIEEIGHPMLVSHGYDGMTEYF